MNTIPFKVIKNVIKKVGGYTMASSENNYTKFHFEFSDDWIKPGIQLSVNMFFDPDNIPDPVLMDMKENGTAFCYIPNALKDESGQLYIGITGTYADNNGNQVTINTLLTSLNIGNGGYMVKYPANDIYLNILNKLSQLAKEDISVKDMIIALQTSKQNSLLTGEGIVIKDDVVSVDGTIVNQTELEKAMESLINDNAPSDTSTFSSNKIKEKIGESIKKEINLDFTTNSGEFFNGKIGSAITISTSQYWSYACIDVVPKDLIRVSTGRNSNALTDKYVFFTDENGIIISKEISVTDTEDYITVELTVPETATKMYVKISELFASRGIKAVLLETVDLQSQISGQQAQIDNNSLDLSMVNSTIKKTATGNGIVNLKNTAENGILKITSNSGVTVKNQNIFEDILIDGIKFKNCNVSYDNGTYEVEYTGSETDTFFFGGTVLDGAKYYNGCGRKQKYSKDLSIRINCDKLTRTGCYITYFNSESVSLGSKNHNTNQAFKIDNVEGAEFFTIRIGFDNNKGAFTTGDIFTFSVQIEYGDEVTAFVAPMSNTDNLAYEGVTNVIGNGEITVEYVPDLNIKTTIVAEKLYDKEDKLNKLTTGSGGWSDEQYPSVAYLDENHYKKTEIDKKLGESIKKKTNLDFETISEKSCGGNIGSKIAIASSIYWSYACIEVKPKAVIKVTTARNANANSGEYVFFTDENDIIISKEISGTDANDITTKILTVPETATKMYVRNSGYFASQGIKVTLIEDYPIYQKIAEIDNKVADPLPSYYTTEWLNSHYSAIREQAQVLNGVSFAFITDLHFPDNAGNSKYLLKNILDYTNVPFALCGGDIAKAYGTQDDCLSTTEQLIDYQNTIGKNRFFSVRGNHDFSIRTSSTEATGYTAPVAKTYNALLRNSEFAISSIQAGKFYYHIDIPAQKTRIFMLCSCDTQRSENTPWGVDYNFSQAQIDWLLEKMQEKDGWYYIFVSHIPADSAISSYSSSQDELHNIMLALKNKTTYGNVDFSNNNNVAVCHITGHNHKNESNVDNNFLSISCSCDACYTDGGLTAQKGTLTEHAIDVFTIDYDNGTIQTHRVGRGSDRSWNY